MTKRFVAAVLAAVAATAAWVWLRPAAPRADPPPPARFEAGCTFIAGDRGAFVLESNVEARGAAERDRFKGVLSWEVTGQPVEGQWLIRAAFTSVVMTQQLSRPENRLTQQLNGPFFVKLGRDCRILEKGFDRSWDTTSRQFAFTLLSTFEFAVAPAGSPSWDLDQFDGLGRYAARYEGTRLPSGAVELTKVKTHYRGQDRTASLGIQLQLVYAQANARLAADGRWLDRVSGIERARLRSQGAVLADLEQHYELTRDDAQFVAPDRGLTAEASDWQDPFQMKSAAVAPPDPDIVRLSLDAALKRFAQLYASTPNGDAYAAALFLSAWLRGNPEQAAQLLAQVRAGAMAEALRPAAFLGLEMCGTPQARAVLMEALADKKLAPMDRARAASALSDVPQPTRASSLALVEASRDTEPQLVSGTAVRALGHLEGRAATLEPGLQAELRDVLVKSLASAHETGRTVDVLDAIGNTADESFVAQLGHSLGDGSPAVREHAAHALRTMKGHDARQLLLARLRVEAEADVRTALVDSFFQLEAHEPEEITLAAQQLAIEPSPIVRAGLIRWLGAAVALPAARAALVAHFHREQLPQLLQLIGQYVSAGELK